MTSAWSGRPRPETRRYRRVLVGATAAKRNDLGRACGVGPRHAEWFSFVHQLRMNGIVPDVTEQEKVHGDLAEAGVVSAMRWAAKSAHARAWGDFDPDTGHNQTVLGVGAHTLLADRMDRAFRCEKYAVDAPEHDQNNVDLLLAGLTPVDQADLPRILDGVTRENVNNSPAWQYADYRWFLQSFEFGMVHDIAWGRKSRTKRQVAAQVGAGNLDQYVLPGTYDEPVDLGLDGVTLRDLIESNATHDTMNLVLAHSVDPHTGTTELFLGRPRLNSEGGPAWFWIIPLMRGGDGFSGAKPNEPLPRPQDTREIADAPVRLRPHAAGEGAATDNRAV